MPKKQLPKFKEHQKSLILIDATGKIEKLIKILQETEYETKTRGTRHLASARLLGFGVYALSLHEEVKTSGGTPIKHSHLSYVMVDPEKPHPLQLKFNVHHEGDMILSVKSPSRKGGPFQSHAEYPSSLIHVFGDRAFAPVNPPSLLNYAGGNLVAIAASPDVHNLGTGAAKLESSAHKEALHISDQQIRHHLHQEKAKVKLPLGPIHGHWE